MDVYSLYYSNYKMFNSTTGEVIVDEECNDHAKPLIAYWLDDSIDSPIINYETLKTAWETFIERYGEDNDESPYWEDLIKFIE